MYLIFRDIASSIKILLDAVNRVIAEMPAADAGTKQVKIFIRLIGQIRLMCTDVLQNLKSLLRAMG